MKRLAVILCSVIVNVLSLSAQTIVDEITQVFSPNAAELGLYGKVPVGHFNGIPDIRVPVTSFKAAGREFPVYLTYHAGGHSPERHPGWVGLGWTLRAGGCVNRIVNNRQDEISHEEIWSERTRPLAAVGTELDTLSYFDYLKTAAGWAADEEAAKAHFRHNVRYGIWCDMEPDEFQVNIEGIQASFYIIGYDASTGRCDVKIRSRQPVDFKVRLFLSDIPGNHFNDDIKAMLFRHISGMVVTASDGTRYIFGSDGSDLSSVEFSIRPSTLSRYGLAVASTWNLTGIEYPGGGNISLKYRKEGRPVVRTILREGRGLGYKIDDDNYGTYLIDSSLPAGTPGSWLSYYVNNNRYSMRDDSPHVKLMFLSPSYLSSIKSGSGGDSLAFHISRSVELSDLGTDEDSTYVAAAELFRTKPGFRDTGADVDIENILSLNYYMRLDSVTQGTRRILFTYGNTPEERLSLASVRTDAGEDYGGEYLFEYNSLKLPDHYCSGSCDRWGFNGRPYSLPAGSYNTLHGRRQPDTTLMKAEIIRKVIYPTGGSTEYEFEAHTYSAAVIRTDTAGMAFCVADYPVDSVAGGLRVRSITDKTGENSVTRRFIYKKDGRSSGILSGTPVFFLRRDYRGRVTIGGDRRGWAGPLYWRDKGSEAGLDLSYWIGSENYMNRLSTTDGNHVTYSAVTEVYPDGGKTEYEYSNHREALDASAGGDISCFSQENPDYILRRMYASHALDRGLLLKRKIFDNTGRPVEEDIYEYDSSPERFSEFVPVCQIGAETFPNLLTGKGDNGSPAESFTYHWTAGSRIYTYLPSLACEKTMTFHHSCGGLTDTLTSRRRYVFDGHKRLTLTVTNASDGSEIRDSVIYSGSDKVCGNGIYREMSSDSVGMTGIPVEKIRFSNGKVVKAELTTYKKVYLTEGTSFVPSAEYSAQLSSPALSFRPYDGLTVDDSYGEPHLEYTTYDGKANPVEIVNEISDTTSLVWGGGTRPVAVFRNASRCPDVVKVQEQGYVSQNVDFRANTNYWFSHIFEMAEEGDCEVAFDIPEDTPDFGFWVIMDRDTCQRPRTRPWVDDGSGGQHDGEVYVEFSRTFRLSAGRHRVAVTTLNPAVHPIPEAYADGNDGSEEEGGGNWSGEESGPASVSNGAAGEDTSVGVSDDVTHPASGWFRVGYIGITGRTVDGHRGSFFYENFEDGRGNDGRGFHSGHGHTGTFNIVLEGTPGRSLVLDYRVLVDGVWEYRRLPFSGPAHIISEGDRPIDEVRVYPVDGSAVTATWSKNDRPLSVSDSKGVSEFFEYDGLGRLSRHLDNGGAPLEAYDYHFRSESDTVNRIITTVYTGSNASGSRTVTDCYDGLGRALSTMAADTAGNGYATLYEYDVNGRPARSWLPVPVNGGFSASGTLKQEAAVFYGVSMAEEHRPFTEYIYDGSPLDRVSAVVGPGQEWFGSGRSFRSERMTNSSVDTSILSCTTFSVSGYSDTSFTIRKEGFYPAGTLLVEKKIDEEGGTAYIFTDRNGRKMLERRILEGEVSADTYYVYDAFDDLRAVLPPTLSRDLKLSASSSWNSCSDPIVGRAFLYVYDHRRRLTASRTPGTGWTLTVRDRTGFPVLTQDASMREKELWAFSVPDALGRICLSGLRQNNDACDGNGVGSLSDQIGDVKVRATRQREPVDTSGTIFGYAVEGLTVELTDRILAVYYHDDHSFIGDYGFSENLCFNQSLDDAEDPMWLWNQGLPTGVLSAVVSPDRVSSEKAVRSAFYYDSQGRSVQTVADYGDGITAVTASKYDFTGNTVRTIEAVAAADVCDTVERTQSYDLMGRLTETRDRLSSGRGIITSNLIAYAYDGIGRLSGVTYGVAPATITESLAYNVRGWLTEKQSGAFDMILRYNNTVYGSSPRWNGSVAEWEWRHDGAAARAYSFTYDAFSRLTDSQMFDGMTAIPSSSFTERGISYDLDGNIITLDRYGASVVSPEKTLVFTYSGSRIASVSGSPIFIHDAAGNMTYDGLKGLHYGYNNLGLVSDVSDSSGVIACYDYLQNGARLSASRADGTGTVNIGSLIYSRDAEGKLSLDQILTEGGRIVAVRDSSGQVAAYRSFHHITDHLSSVRAVVDASSGSVVERYDYLPFGMRIPQVASADTISTLPALSSPNRWYFSGKEEQTFLDPSLGILDFGARMYDPSIARWLSPDPLAGNNQLISPYSYCSNNPIIIIDPFGKDEWDINKKGKIIAHRLNDQYDIFNIVEKDEILPVSKSFAYKTFVNENGYFLSSDLNSGIELFSFLSKETSVEFGLVITIDNKSFIHTDNKEKAIGIVPVAMGISDKGYTVTSIIHSHPNNTIPSGFNSGNTIGDKFSAAEFIESHGFPVENYVYQPKNDWLIQYTKDKIIPGVLFWNTIFR